MKTAIKLLAVFVLMLATFSQHTTASAGGIQKSKAWVAYAQFSSVDPSGCILTTVDIFGEDLVVGSGPGSASSDTQLTIYQYDACTDTVLLDAHGSASLADRDFRVSGNLDSATLNATASIYDYVSHSYFDVFVDLTWTGTGSLNHYNDQSRWHSPGCNSINHFISAFRYEEASGIVSDGETDFAPAPSVSAYIYSNKIGDVSAGCH